jgi:phospholipid/cholesterol/gamma-HCH transport system ATP-binding protein
VLFDEPTTSLDPVSARRVDRLIRELSDTLGVTSVVVSHDLASIFSIADRVAMLYKGKAAEGGDAGGVPRQRRPDRAPVRPRHRGRDRWRCEGDACND